jgi:Holliday junction DNA helicase RuvA
VIASVSGKVLASSLGAVTVEVGGVGLLVHTTNRIASELTIGKPATLFTVLVVREDSLTLYGFLEALELETFDLLRSVNGVGPKSALSILSSLSVGEIADAVASESDAVFRSVSGVGVKTAKLIALSLAGKISGGSTTSVGSGADKVSVEALVGLGYSEKEAGIAVRKVSNPNLSDQDVLKLALQQLAKTGLK